MLAWEKEAKQRKLLKEKLEKSISNEVVEQIYNEAIYDFNSLSFGMRSFCELGEQEVQTLKRIIAVSRQSVKK